MEAVRGYEEEKMKFLELFHFHRNDLLSFDLNKLSLKESFHVNALCLLASETFIV